MDPVSLGVASLVSTAAGTGVSMFGAAKTGQANAQSAQYQAMVARNNQIIANQNAEYAIASGDVQSQNLQMKTRAQIGQERATQGANGLDVNSGSNLSVQRSTAELGELDALTILNNAQGKAAAYRAQGMNFGADAQLDDMKANNASLAGELGVATSFASGASSFSDKWLGYQQKGVF